jgi:hypothetical protein
LLIRPPGGTREFANELTTWIWVVASVGLTIATYTVLFRNEIWATLQRMPTYVRSLNYRNIPTVAIRWLSIVRYVLGAAWRPALLILITLVIWVWDWLWILVSIQQDRFLDRKENSGFCLGFSAFQSSQPYFILLLGDGLGARR